MKLFHITDMKIYLMVIIIPGLLTTSCKKLIEIPANPINQLGTSRVFADSANIVAAVAGVYSNFGASSYSPEFGSGAITIYTGLMGDELVPGSDTYTAPAFYSNNVLPDNKPVQAMWANAYKNIFQINLCLEGIAGSKAIGVAFERRLTAELKVDRAWYYFHMINLWGGVPIVTSTDYNATRNIRRASVPEVYSFILADLSDATKDLTSDYPSQGRARPNLYAAFSLLSKVYLYLGQYQNAIDAANRVISSPDYELEENLNDVFRNGSKEAIWQLPANGASRQTPEAATFIPFASDYQPTYAISDRLLDAIETKDLRKVNWMGSTTISAGGISSTYYYPYKYKNTQAGVEPLEDYMMLRLADIYLVRAEALAELGRLPEALPDLNRVRKRAGLDDIKTDSKEIAISAIVHERQVEMFCEWGNRWFDLKRSKTIDEVLSAAKPSWKPSAALFPIPTAERQANPFLDQNLNY